MRTLALVFISVLLSACGSGSYDLSNSTDRLAMKLQIKQDLSNGDCGSAIVLSTELDQSSYSDNEIRMLFASAQACNAGIQLFQLLDDISNASLSSPDAIIRTFVKLFPSNSSDSRMQSSWFAQDALQTVLNPGVVVAPANQINFSSPNPGSALVSDRNLDSGSYLMFVSMAVIGTTLNRYGYSSSQSPASLSYAQGQDLSWTSQSAVQADSTGAACALVSGFFNLFDGIDEVVTYLSGSSNAQFQLISTNLKSGFALVGTNQCLADHYSAAECAAAAARITYRGACAESAQAASFAAGVIAGINLGWQ